LGSIFDQSATIMDGNTVTDAKFGLFYLYLAF